MQFRTIVAAFFFRGDREKRSLRELVGAAGMTNLAPLNEDARAALGLHESDREIVGGTWGAFGKTWAILDDVEDLVCLQLYSSMNHYYNAQIVENDRQATHDTELPFVASFRDACLRLQPVAAFLDTRAHYGDERWENQQGNRGWVLSQSRMVAASDADALADERYSLLYLTEPLARLWNSNPIRDDRDAVEVPTGRLVFARSGPARMA